MPTRDDGKAAPTNGKKPNDNKKALVEKATRVVIDTYKKALKELEKH